ncbi:hypothetical protein GW17_00040774 [Ensete ventricosum]|nr:hypothetical protein GW17_00040774 [Ensete ventricosum]
MQWDLTGSSLGESPKESGSSLGKRREIAGKKTGGLAAIVGGCQSMREIRAVANSFRRVNRPVAGEPPVPQNLGDDQMLMAGKPPRSAVNHPYQDFPDTVGF